MPKHQVQQSQTVVSHLRTSLKKIDQVSKAGDEYIDLVLIHAPWGGPSGRASNWRAFAEAQKEGFVRDIGVSNL